MAKVPCAGLNAMLFTGCTVSTPASLLLWHLKAYFLACPASDWSKYSMATRPSTEPTAKPVPSGKQRTQRVWNRKDDSRSCSGNPASSLHVKMLSLFLFCPSQPRFFCPCEGMCQIAFLCTCLLVPSSLVSHPCSHPCSPCLAVEELLPCVDTIHRGRALVVCQSVVQCCTSGAGCFSRGAIWLGDAHLRMS